MIETTSDFPFVAALAKREKSKVRKLWDECLEFADVVANEGAFIPVMVACSCLDLSRTRVEQLMAEGRLRRYVVGDRHVYISLASVRALAESERKTGRPLKEAA